MADIGVKLEMDQETIAKLRSGQKLWAASHDDGSKNRINEDAVLEAASCDLSLGILTALFMWVRKKFRNRGKTKAELTAEKEAAKINRSCGALDVMLLEYVQSAQKGMIDEETLDDLIRTLEEMHGYDQAGKMIIPDREVLIEIRDAIVKYTSLIADGRVARLVLPSETTGDFNIIRDQCKFRKLMNENGLGEKYFAACKEFLEQHGRIMHGGTIVDATIIDAPSSTKNAEGKRDPEMHQTKKGNQWYFGAKLHAGVDAGTGYIHSLEVTAANVHDSAVATKLIREDDTVLYGDSAYCAVEKHADVQADPHLSAIEYRTNRQKPYRKNAWQEGEGTRWLKEMEYQKSRVRCKVEYVFHIIKNQFKFRKTRYRGTAKLKTKLSILCASANYYMLARSRRAEIEAKSLLAFLYEAAPQG